MRGRIALLAVALALAPTVASAQEGRFSFGAGLAWSAGYDAGDSRATETSNPGVSANPLQLFTVAARADATPGLAAFAGWRIAGRLSLEAEGQFARPVLSASLSQDFEGAPSVEARTTFTQVLVGGSVVYRVTAPGKLMAFIEGGGAYVRRVTADGAAAETSSELHAGGGFEIGLTEHFAVRADARLSALSHAIGFAPERRFAPQVLGMLVYRP